jgi:hypothetical protein
VTLTLEYSRSDWMEVWERKNYILPMDNSFSSALLCLVTIILCKLPFSALDSVFLKRKIMCVTFYLVTYEEVPTLAVFYKLDQNSLFLVS